MTTFQKIIKYLAVGLAMFICITLLTGLVGGIKALFENLNIIKNEDSKYNEVINYNNNNDFSYLDISLNNSNLIIKNGDKFSIDTSDKNVKIYNENGKLRIIDKNVKIFNRKIKNFIITVPYEYNFEAVKIETGAGKVNIEDINTNSLEMNLGAGKTYINNISSNLTNIETGAGSVEIRNSKLNNLDLELGVGNIKIESEITGTSEIECGIGALDLSLLSLKENYRFEFEKGIGKIMINGEPVLNNSIMGEGNNSIKIEGGIGEINIKTLDELK